MSMLLEGNRQLLVSCGDVLAFGNTRGVGREGQETGGSEGPRLGYIVLIPIALAFRSVANTTHRVR